jgi:hypothetical protein
MDVRLHRHVTSSQVKISYGVKYHLNRGMPFEHAPPGLIGADTLRLLMIGLPLRSREPGFDFGFTRGLTKPGFRRVVLGLLLISGGGLLARGS